MHDLCSPRYNSLTEPAASRSMLLQQSLHLQQFFRDVRDQLRWLQEKQRIAVSDEVGQDLLGRFNELILQTGILRMIKIAK